MHHRSRNSAHHSLYSRSENPRKKRGGSASEAEIRLHSTEWVNTPSIFHYALNAVDKNRAAKILAAYYLPKSVIDDLISGDRQYREEGDIVVVPVTHDELDAIKANQAIEKGRRGRNPNPSHSVGRTHNPDDIEALRAAVRHAEDAYRRAERNKRNAKAELSRVRMNDDLEDYYIMDAERERDATEEALAEAGEDLINAETALTEALRRERGDARIASEQAVSESYRRRRR